MLITLINRFAEYVNNIYNFLKYFTIKKNKNIQENTIHENIYLFLHDISNQWKYNNIQNIDLLCDILNIYYKYNYNDNIEKTLVAENKETYFKYYVLGWYIYNHIEKKIEQH